MYRSDLNKICLSKSCFAVFMSTGSCLDPTRFYPFLPDSTDFQSNSVCASAEEPVLCRSTLPNIKKGNHLTCMQQLSAVPSERAIKHMQMIGNRVGSQNGPSNTTSFKCFTPPLAQVYTSSPTPPPPPHPTSQTQTSHTTPPPSDPPPDTQQHPSPPPS